MKPDIIEFITDPQLLGLSVSPAQETLLRGIYGLPLPSQDHLDLWRECTGRDTYPGQPFDEVTVMSGARGGKDSRIAAPIVVYESVFGGHERHLAKGEHATVVLVAQDQRATKIAFTYIREYLEKSPLLSSLVEEVLTSEVVLTNGISISCFPCTLRSLRGWSIPVGVLDEVGFYRLEGQADSDVEVQTSVRRGMLNFPHPRLIKISTPYMRSGVLYDDFKKAFGQDNLDVLVWRASSLLMNPSLRAQRLEREQRLDPDRYAREYLAEFAEDLEAFLPSAWIEGAVISGRYELPPRDGVRYLAAVDPSGGGADAFTLSIVHAEEGTVAPPDVQSARPGRIGTPPASRESGMRRVVQDVMKGWSKPRSGQMNLEGVVQEIADILKRYRLSTVIGDKYAGTWVREAFKRAGITYEEPTIRKDGEPVALDKSAAYLETEPLFAQGHIEILDHPALIRELKNLERRPRAGGKTLVDHPHGGHDDHANALALAAARARQGRIVPRAGAVIEGITRVGRPSLLAPGRPWGNAGGVNWAERWKEGL